MDDISGYSLVDGESQLWVVRNAGSTSGFTYDYPPLEIKTIKGVSYYVFKQSAKATVPPESILEAVPSSMVCEAFVGYNININQGNTLCVSVT
jgi:hypothetical protein